MAWKQDTDCGESSPPFRQSSGEQRGVTSRVSDIQPGEAGRPAGWVAKSGEASRQATVAELRGHRQADRRAGEREAVAISPQTAESWE